MGVIYFSQYKQDKFFNEVIFANKKDGFFIDIGAHDGITINNSIFFERYLRWTGICIEPNPKVFKDLIKNRKSINLNVCVGNENKKVHFTQIEGHSEMLSGITEKYHEKHLERITNAILSKGGLKIEIEVDMVKLDSIASLKEKEIDFISIDTEGNEFDIIKSINFNELNIKSIVVENNYKDNKIEEFLIPFGFVKIYKLNCDDVFLNKRYFSAGIKLRLLIWRSKSILMKIKQKINIK